MEYEPLQKLYFLLENRDIPASYVSLPKGTLVVSQCMETPTKKTHKKDTRCYKGLRDYQKFAKYTRRFGRSLHTGCKSPKSQAFIATHVEARWHWYLGEGETSQHSTITSGQIITFHQHAFPLFIGDETLGKKATFWDFWSCEVAIIDLTRLYDVIIYISLIKNCSHSTLITFYTNLKFIQQFQKTQSLWLKKLLPPPFSLKEQKHQAVSNLAWNLQHVLIIVRTWCQRPAETGSARWGASRQGVDTTSPQASNHHHITYKKGPHITLVIR